MTTTALLSSAPAQQEAPDDLIKIKRKVDGQDNVIVQFFIPPGAIKALFGDRLPSRPALRVTGTASEGFGFAADKHGVFLRNVGRKLVVNAGWKRLGLGKEFPPISVPYRTTDHGTIATDPLPELTSEPPPATGDEIAGWQMPAAPPREKRPVPKHTLKRIALMIMDINDLVQSANGSIRLKVTDGKLKAIALQLAEMEIS